MQPAPSGHDQVSHAINCLVKLSRRMELNRDGSQHGQRLGIAVALVFTVRARKAQLLLICAIALLVGALNLPPYGIGIDEAVWTWREIGGPSWCACLFLLALGWIGSKTLSVRTKE